MFGRWLYMPDPMPLRTVLVGLIAHHYGCDAPWPPTNTVVATVAVGTNPQGVAVNPAGTRAYVANFDSNSVSVIDTATNTVVATVAVGIGPIGVAVADVTVRRPPADFDGDGKTDASVFRRPPVSGACTGLPFRHCHNFGTSGDIPVPAN